MMRRPSRHDLMSGALREKLGLLGVVMVVILMLPAGVYLAFTSGDLHWINRMGAAIVCVQAFIVTIELNRRKRLEAIRTRYKTASVEAEVEKAERAIVNMGVALAIFGESVHGFGDLLLGSLVSGLGH